MLRDAVFMKKKKMEQEFKNIYLQGSRVPLFWLHLHSKTCRARLNNLIGRTSCV